MRIRSSLFLGMGTWLGCLRGPAEQNNVGSKGAEPQSSSEHQTDQPVAPAWPWLHLDYKCNTDLVSADPTALSTLGIPSRDSRLIMSSQVCHTHLVDWRRFAPSSCCHATTSQCLERDEQGQETLTFFLTRGSALLAAIGALRLVIAHDQLYILSSSRGFDLETADPPTTDNAFVRYLVSTMRGKDAGAQLG